MHRSRRTRPPQGGTQLPPDQAHSHLLRQGPHLLPDRACAAVGRLQGSWRGLCCCWPRRRAVGSHRQAHVSLLDTVGICAAALAWADPFCCRVSHCAVGTWDACRPCGRILLPTSNVVGPSILWLHQHQDPFLTATSCLLTPPQPAQWPEWVPRSCCAHAPALQAQVCSTIGSPQAECREELNTQCVELNRQLTGLRSCLEAVQDVVGVDGTTLWQNSFQRVMQVSNMYWRLNLTRVAVRCQVCKICSFGKQQLGVTRCPCTLTISCSTVCLPRCVCAQSTMFNP